MISSMHLYSIIGRSVLNHPCLELSYQLFMAKLVVLNSCGSPITAQLTVNVVITHVVSADVHHVASSLLFQEAQRCKANSEHVFPSIHYHLQAYINPVTSINHCSQ